MVDCKECKYSQVPFSMTVLSPFQYDTAKTCTEHGMTGGNEMYRKWHDRWQ